MYIKVYTYTLSWYIIAIVVFSLWRNLRIKVVKTILKGRFPHPRMGWWLHCHSSWFFLMRENIWDMYLGWIKYWLYFPTQVGKFVQGSDTKAGEYAWRNCSLWKTIQVQAYPGGLQAVERNDALAGEKCNKEAEAEWRCSRGSFHPPILPSTSCVGKVEESGMAIWNSVWENGMGQGRRSFKREKKGVNSSHHPSLFWLMIN